MMAEVFMEDDAGYLKWLRDNSPDGFVLNCDNPPNSPDGYRMLHCTTCGTIKPKNRYDDRNWTLSYSKVCSLDKQELIIWAKQKIGFPPWDCGICNP